MGGAQKPGTFSTFLSFVFHLTLQAGNLQQPRCPNLPNAGIRGACHWVRLVPGIFLTTHRVQPLHGLASLWMISLTVKPPLSDMLTLTVQGINFLSDLIKHINIPKRPLWTCHLFMTLNIPSLFESFFQGAQGGPRQADYNGVQPSLIVTHTNPHFIWVGMITLGISYASS